MKNIVPGSRGWNIALLFCCLFLFPVSASAQIRQGFASVQGADRWILSNFAKGKVPPFSFIYDGRPSTEFISGWVYKREKLSSGDPDIENYRFTYTDPKTELKVVCDVRGFIKFGAVEWVLSFINASGVNSKMLESVRVADYCMVSGKDQDFVLYHAEGSSGLRSDFMLSRSVLEKGRNIRLKPEGGRSSDHTSFPFFNIAFSDKCGVVAAIGWTGGWYADVLRGDERSVTLQSGMERMKLYLYPGESIRTPRIALMFWEGDGYMAGQNQFRRFMLAHHSRKLDGKYAQYPLAGGFEWGDPAPCNEYCCLTEEFAVALVKRYKQFGIMPEVYWLDAGWYAGCGGPDFNGSTWATAVGNWTVDSIRFPRGLRPIADEIHKQGAKFMVWFEPERVMKGSRLATEHPEWMLRIPDNDTYLLDLGNPAACAWACSHFSNMIEENGIDYYRQDFNMQPAYYWEFNEEPGRVGIKEIRHIEGLYRYWDYLLTRFPKLLIDNCASGGRRLDLETCSRSAPLWRTDYQYGEPDGYQCHTYGLNFFLPIHGTGVFQADDYCFRSGMSSAMAVNWEINSLRGSIADMQRIMETYKELRPYFYEDYYPLTGIRNITGDDIWLAYQMHRPSDGSGIVLAFRRKEALSELLEVKLAGLEAGVMYELYDYDTKQVSSKTGAELASGVTLKITEKPGSKLIGYKPAGK